MVRLIVEKTFQDNKLYIEGFCTSQDTKPTSGIITGSMKLIHHCQDLGMQIFSCNSEVGLLAKQLKAMVAEFNG